MRSPPSVAGFVLALSAALAAAGCPRAGSKRGAGSPTGDGAGSGSDVTPESPLYARLGGMDGIRAVVDELVGQVAADQRIQKFFVAADFRRLKSQLVVQICELAGGPCRYRGNSMRTAHAGRGIRSEHFDAWMEDASEAFLVARVGERERRELLALLRDLKPEIVESAE